MIIYRFYHFTKYTQRLGIMQPIAWQGVLIPIRFLLGNPGTTCTNLMKRAIESSIGSRRAGTKIMNEFYLFICLEAKAFFPEGCLTY